MWTSCVGHAHKPHIRHERHRECDPHLLRATRCADAFPFASATEEGAVALASKATIHDKQSLSRSRELAERLIRVSLYNEDVWRYAHNSIRAFPPIAARHSIISTFSMDTHAALKVG